MFISFFLPHFPSIYFSSFYSFALYPQLILSPVILFLSPLSLISLIIFFFFLFSYQYFHSAFLVLMPFFPSQSLSPFLLFLLPFPPLHRSFLFPTGRHNILILTQTHILCSCFCSLSSVPRFFSWSCFFSLLRYFSTSLSSCLL